MSMSPVQTMSVPCSPTLTLPNNSGDRRRGSKISERLDHSGHVHAVFVAVVPPDAQSQRLFVGGHGGDARQNLLRHGHPRSFSSAHLSTAFPMRPSPLQRLGDLAPRRLAGNHGEIGYSHKNLKVRPNNMEVRRAMIVGIHADADGAKTLQCRHSQTSESRWIPISESATIAHFLTSVKKLNRVQRPPPSRTGAIWCNVAGSLDLLAAHALDRAE